MASTPEIEQAQLVRFALNFYLRQLAEAQAKLKSFLEDREINIHSVMDIHIALSNVDAGAHMVRGSLRSE